jgi:hypothetical protein
MQAPANPDHWCRTVVGFRAAANTAKRPREMAPIWEELAVSPGNRHLLYLKERE